MFRAFRILPNAILISRQFGKKNDVHKISHLINTHCKCVCDFCIFLMKLIHFDFCLLYFIDFFM